MLYVLLNWFQNSPAIAHTVTSVVCDKEEWENLKNMPFEPTVDVNSSIIRL
jgi:hypothetical protein